MEAGAKGQVGGMEMGNEDRLRLARDSRGWACEGCGGRSNEDVLREQAKMAEEVGGNKTVEKVPEDLKFGFRDEMTMGKEKTITDGVETSNAGAGSRNPSSLTAPGSSPSTVSLSSQQPLSTRTITSPASSTRSPYVRPPAASEPVPAWIDKAIAGVVAGLALMIIRKIML